MFKTCTEYQIKKICCETYSKIAQIGLAKSCNSLYFNFNLIQFAQFGALESGCRIPILPVAKEILKKYENNPVAQTSNRLLPILSNQKMNSSLKKIEGICSINKTLTMHVARHTFATSVTLTNGVPIETVSKMLGHSSLKTTQIYAKIVDSKISNDMNDLKMKGQG